MEFMAGGPEGRPTPEQMQLLRRLMGPSDNELPVVLGLNEPLVRTADLAVALISSAVYSTGAMVNMIMLSRAAAPPGVPGRPGGWLMPHAGDGAGRWLLGVEYPDGRTATTLPGNRPPDVLRGPVDEDRPRLAVRHGSGGRHGFDSKLWLAPLPPPGPLRFVFAWPAQGVPETTSIIDGTPWSDAARRVVALWDAPRDGAPAPLAPSPDLQAGGWFDRNTGRT